VSGTRVLVAGASIAGPALAHWLRRRGAGVTVVERAPGLRPGGQAVDARGVTREVIRRMGLDAAVRAARTETAGACTVDADGKVLETYRADDDGGDGYISEIEILRGDLSRVLHDDTRDGGFNGVPGGESGEKPLAVSTYVMSATHRQAGATAVKSRSSRSDGRGCPAGAGTVVRGFLLLAAAPRCRVPSSAARPCTAPPRCLPVSAAAALSAPRRRAGLFSYPPTRA
jgi:hypothetical protein